MLRAQSSRVPHPANVSIEWYRTKLPKGVSEKIHRKSDFRAALQTVGWLANLALWFVLALRVHSAFALLYCMQVNFAINAMHELGHRTVFKTKVLNDVFLRVVSFLGWLHPDMFFSSHLRHHRYVVVCQSVSFSFFLSLSLSLHLSNTPSPRFLRAVTQLHAQ